MLYGTFPTACDGRAWALLVLAKRRIGPSDYLSSQVLLTLMMSRAFDRNVQELNMGPSTDRACTAVVSLPELPAPQPLVISHHCPLWAVLLPASSVLPGMNIALPLPSFSSEHLLSSMKWEFPLPHIRMDKSNHFQGDSVDYQKQTIAVWSHSRFLSVTFLPHAPSSIDLCLQMPVAGKQEQKESACLYFLFIGFPEASGLLAGPSQLFLHSCQEW